MLGFLKLDNETIYHVSYCIAFKPVSYLHHVEIDIYIKRNLKSANSD